MKPIFSSIYFIAKEDLAIHKIPSTIDLLDFNEIEIKEEYRSESTGKEILYFLYQEVFS